MRDQMNPCGCDASEPEYCSFCVAIMRPEPTVSEEEQRLARLATARSYAVDRAMGHHVFATCTDRYCGLCFTSRVNQWDEIP